MIVLQRTPPQIEYYYDPRVGGDTTNLLFVIIIEPQCIDTSKSLHVQPSPKGKENCVRILKSLIGNFYEPSNRGMFIQPCSGKETGRNRRQFSLVTDTNILFGHT